ncbi:water dikinase [Cystoisospora suis]|uniref:Water dikinase n=1 Tax=Cystoisospora suis TaxID=483139 RepID=A0A2C6L3W4_9APIC|nr:water dikinase [Cystoisospora suis]
MHLPLFFPGDVASILGCPRPKAGVYAVRAGPPLDRNLRKVLEYGEGAKLYHWKPQTTYLSLVSCGDDYAIANKGNVSFEGQWVWKLKRFIDLKWMRMYQELPQMNEDLPLYLNGDLHSFLPILSSEVHTSSPSSSVVGVQGSSPSGSRWGGRAQRFLGGKSSTSSLAKEKDSDRDEPVGREHQRSKSWETVSGSGAILQDLPKRNGHGLESEHNKGLLTLLAYVSQLQHDEKGLEDSSLPHPLTRPHKRLDSKVKKMRCGGCAGKIPSSVLRHALHELQREDQRQATMSCMQNKSHEQVESPSRERVEDLLACQEGKAPIEIAAASGQRCQGNEVEGDRRGRTEGGKDRALEQVCLSTTTQALAITEEKSGFSNPARSTGRRDRERGSGDPRLLTYRDEVLVGLDDADDACVFSATPMLSGGVGCRGDNAGHRKTRIFVQGREKGDTQGVGGGDLSEWRSKDSRFPPETQACDKESARQPLLVQTVDFFRSFYEDTYILGRIAATHALSDCYAMGAEPMIALLTAVIPYGSDHVMQNTLLQLLGGCCSVLSREHCELVGGHSAEGTEVSAGLTITGRIIPGDREGTSDTCTSSRICKSCQAHLQEQVGNTDHSASAARDSGTHEDDLKEKVRQGVDTALPSLKSKTEETKDVQTKERDSDKGEVDRQEGQTSEENQEEKGKPSRQYGTTSTVAGRKIRREEKGRDRSQSHEDNSGEEEKEKEKMVPRVSCPLCIAGVGYLAKGSARAQGGDALILAKALGTGIVMAGCLQGKAKGRWVMNALDHMQVSNRKAAEIFMAHGATACTDVTGFGLLGHLVEMLSACRKARAQAEGAAPSARKTCVGSSAGEAQSAGGRELSSCSFGANCERASDRDPGQLLCARLFLSLLPLLDGVVELMADGVHSSLLPGNAKFFSAISQKAWVRGTGRGVPMPSEGARCLTVPALLPVLFDPQTSGGLLAVVPAHRATECLASLRDEGGYKDSAIIGHLFQETPPPEGHDRPMGTATCDNMRASVECLS